MRVLGIDPGITNTGYGLVEESGGKLLPGDFGSIETKSTDDMSHRLDTLYEGVKMVMMELEPDEVVLEQLFFNTNLKTAVAVGQARGVILLACRHLAMPWTEYTPLQVKQAVVGNGNATKNQVQFMVGALLDFEPPKSHHSCDALAMAICHLNARRLSRRTGI